MVLRQNWLDQARFMPTERLFEDLRGLVAANLGSTESWKGVVAYHGLHLAPLTLTVPGGSVEIAAMGLQSEPIIRH